MVKKIFLGFLTAFVLIGIIIFNVDTLRVNTVAYLYKRYARIRYSNFENVVKLETVKSKIDNIEQGNFLSEQIQSDLKPYKQGLNEDYLNKQFEKYNLDKNKLAFFTVQDGRVLIETSAKNLQTRACKALKQVLEYLAKHKLISNTKFVVILEDFLQEIPGGIKHDEALPFFTFAKDTARDLEKSTILIPDWMNISYWKVLKWRIDTAAKMVPFAKKINKVHWRGGSCDSSGHRGQLVALSKELDFVDAYFTDGEFPKDFIVPELSMKYRYQVSLDGARCTWERVVWQLQSNCLMLKPDSTQVQWFYKGLKAGENYIRLKEITKESLTNTVTELNKNPVKANQIARNATEFANSYLTEDDFVAYFAVLINEYSKLIAP